MFNLFYIFLHFSAFSATAATQTYCGGYSPAGTLQYADALLIPQAETANGNGNGFVNNFCGQGAGFYGKTSMVGATAMTYNTICCK